MFGRNQIEKRSDDPQNLKIKDIFYSVQGEGPDSGKPAIFIRLAGCNLQCPFCDTEFEKEIFIASPKDLVEGAENRARVESRIKPLVVITGGEPLLQEIGELVCRLNAAGFPVQIETNGTIWRPSLLGPFRTAPMAGNSIICSPKTPQIAREMIPLISAWKYIIFYDETDPMDGLPTRTHLADFATGGRPFIPMGVLRDRIFLQPADLPGNPQRSSLNMRAAIQSCLKHGYRLSLQIQKIAGVL
jgi:7-carboxy-7-deazaguanine synthase